ncbi:hypothetical protein DY467_10060 [Rhodopseudomonas sp. BR0G17]|nr:hypothetical protein [Rhodopseudomonas sp. BR0G17]
MLLGCTSFFFEECFFDLLVAMPWVEPFDMPLSDIPGEPPPDMPLFILVESCGAGPVVWAEAVPANVPIAAQQRAASNACFMGELLSLSRRPNRKAV